MRTHYDNLQVSRSASQRVIRAAYKSLSQEWHPDKHPHDRDKAEKIMKIINRAYEVLSDPASRAEHDKWIVDQVDEQNAHAEEQHVNQETCERRNSEESNSQASKNRQDSTSSNIDSNASAPEKAPAKKDKKIYYAFYLMLASIAVIVVGGGGPLTGFGTFVLMLGVPACLIYALISRAIGR